MKYNAETDNNKKRVCFYVSYVFFFMDNKQSKLEAIQEVP